MLDLLSLDTIDVVEAAKDNMVFAMDIKKKLIKGNMGIIIKIASLGFIIMGDSIIITEAKLENTMKEEITDCKPKMDGQSYLTSITASLGLGV